MIGPVCAIALLGFAQLLVFRAFPAGSAFAYPWLDLVGITGFAVCGALLARGDSRARPLVGVFLAYLVLGWAAKLYPSALGGNATRLLDYIALPLLALVAALRGFRPRLLVVVALGVAVAWQSVPLIKNAVGGYTDQAQAATFWNPALDFLRPIAQRAPNFRVEVVATWGHSEAYYLPKSGIPLAGGWYRQNAYRPQDLPGYRGGPVTPALYRDWLRAMGVRYVLLPHDELDPAARAEAALLRQGVPGLTLVRASSSSHLAIYELHDASPILTPPPGAPESAVPAHAHPAHDERFHLSLRARRRRLQSESELHALLAGRRPDGRMRRARSRTDVAAARHASRPRQASRLGVLRGCGDRRAGTRLCLAADAASELTYALVPSLLRGVRRRAPHARAIPASRLTRDDLEP